VRRCSKNYKAARVGKQELILNSSYNAIFYLRLFNFFFLLVILLA
jgi:hypothetical protein